MSGKENDGNGWSGCMRWSLAYTSLKFFQYEPRKAVVSRHASKPLRRSKRYLSMIRLLYTWLKLTWLRGYFRANAMNTVSAFHFNCSSSCSSRSASSVLPFYICFRGFFQHGLLLHPHRSHVCPVGLVFIFGLGAGNFSFPVLIAGDADGGCLLYTSDAADE